MGQKRGSDSNPGVWIGKATLGLLEKDQVMKDIS